MEIDVSPVQLWHFPLGTSIAACRSRLALGSSDVSGPSPPTDGSHDGMYVEAFDTRWLATITFKDGRIHRQTLLAMTSEPKDFKHLYTAIRTKFGRAYRRGILKATGYVWEFPSSQLILTLKDAGPLTGIYLILTAKP